MRPLILLLSLVNFTCFAQKDSTFSLYETFATDSVKKDLEILRTLLTEVHPGVNLHTTPEKINRVIDSIVQTVKGPVTGLEFQNIVSYVFAQMHDSHTMIYYTEYNSMQQKKPKLFPLQLTYIGGKYYVKKTALPQYGSLVGQEIDSINKFSVDQIAKKIWRFASVEGTNTSNFEQRLWGLSYGYYLLFDTISTTFTVNVKDIRGTVTKKQLSGASVGSADSLWYPPLPPVEQSFDGDSIAILTVHSFITDNYINAKIDHKKYFQSFFKTVAKKKITKVIIDVRNNEGGREEVVNELFSWLYPGEYYYYEYKGVLYNKVGEWKKYIEQPFNPGFDSTKTPNELDLYCYTEKDDENNANWLMKNVGKKNAYTGKTIVLIDGGSFSATGHFIALVKNHKKATLVGECSLGSYYSNAGLLIFRLPATQLRTYVPVARVQMRVPDFVYDPKGICPDYEIHSQQKDLRVEYDRQLETAKTLFNKISQK